MANKQTTLKPMRMALLLNWRSKGFQRPHYGLIDDEELLRNGKSIFTSADGRQLSTTRNELLLLQQAGTETVPLTRGSVASNVARHT